MSEPVTNYRSIEAEQRAKLVAGVRAIIADVKRQMTDAVVEARGVERFKAIIEDDESPAERCRRENASALIRMARGSTPMQVARWMSPNNPSKRHMYAQRFRRLLREKKDAQCASEVKTPM
jgi:hypothetical protein